MSGPAIHFATPAADGRWRDAADHLADPAAVAPRIINGVDCWIAWTWLMLRRRHPELDVRLSPRVVPGAINVVHRDDLKPGRRPWRAHLVGIQADRSPIRMADLVVVQNEAAADAPGRRYLPHWPQAGLIPRDPAAGGRFATVAYLGRADSLPADLRSEDFQRRLAALGLRFSIRHRDWHDMSDVDAVLGIRVASPALLAAKPASKLVNAWHAGVPALLGPEPAYRALRRGDLDFIEVADADAAVAALARLRDDPARRAAMAANGRARAADYTEAAVAARWAGLLAEVAAAHPAWRRRTWCGRSPARLAWGLAAALAQHREHRRFPRG